MTSPDPHASPTAARDRDWKWDGTDKLDRIIDHGGWDAVVNAHAWYDDDADEHDPPRACLDIDGPVRLRITTDQALPRSRSRPHPGQGHWVSGHPLRRGGSDRPVPGVDSTAL